MGHNLPVRYGGIPSHASTLPANHQKLIKQHRNMARASTFLVGAQQNLEGFEGRGHGRCGETQPTNPNAVYIVTNENSTEIRLLVLLSSLGHVLVVEKSRDGRRLKKTLE